MKLKESKLMQEAIASDLNPEEIFRLEGYLLSLPELEREAAIQLSLKEWLIRNHS